MPNGQPGTPIRMRYQDGRTITNKTDQQISARGQQGFPVCPSSYHVVCPVCHSPEEHPDRKHVDKHGWWSQCLVCAGYYDSKLNYVEPKDPERAKRKGWFLCKQDAQGRGVFNMGVQHGTR